MIDVEGKLIDKKVNNIRFFLNYPEIKVSRDNKEIYEFTKIVNKFIQNEVSIFEEIMINTYIEENLIGNINSISEFKVAFNKNNIISIPIEFSQMFGLTDISNIYSYNYDLNLKKKITLSDIFKNDVNFEKIIENYITEKIYDVLNDYISCDIYEFMEDIIYICDSPDFYFNENEIVICVSSFELTSKICNLIEFPIEFKKIKNILSDYALKNIFP